MARQTPDAELQPILHDPWEEPTSHYEFNPEDPTAKPVYRDSRRKSQPSISDLSRSDNDLVHGSSIDPYTTINKIRVYVAKWKETGYRGSPAKKLLERWDGSAHDQSGATRPFFCQREAIETLMWLLRDHQDEHLRTIKRQLQAVNAKWNDGLNRLAVKMATGAGKTRAMAMLIGCLEKIHPSGCTIVVINPNLTVSSRLQSLLHDVRDSEIVPKRDRTASHAKIYIRNFHKFRQNEEAFSSFGGTPPALVKKVLRASTRLETPEAMLDRVLDRDPEGLPLYVFQDEGHHCRRREEQVTKGSDRDDEYDQEGQWFSALLHLRNHRNLKAVIDFSATPAYLKAPSDLPTALFPWCVTDYQVEDAIEAGICKIPRLPERARDTEPGMWNLYQKCIDVEKQTRKWGQEPPQEVKDLVQALAEDWESTRLEPFQKANRVPAVIAVVNSVANAIVLYNWIAGSRDGEYWKAGAIDAFSNIDPITNEPITQELLPTLMVHSRIGEDASEGSSQENKITKEQLELRAPGKSVKEAREIIQQIYQTVGKVGEAGQNIRCVISVSMLSEGWDAKTVTHVFGFRRFNSVLLIEQVIGRALRRPSLDTPATPEYAEVFGVPYPGLRRIGIESDRPIPPPPPPVEVKSLDSKSEFRIEWPNISHLATQAPEGKRYRFDPTLVTPWTPDLPKPILIVLKDPTGHGERHGIKTKIRRTNWVLYRLAAELSEFWLNSSNEDGTSDNQLNLYRRGLLFADAKSAIQQWLRHELIEVSRIDVLTELGHRHQVVEAVAQCCVNEQGRAAAVIPVFEDRHNPTQDTDNQEFTTTLPNIRKPLKKSHLSAAACHSTWETRVAKQLDDHPAVRAWVRNFRLDWRIPYWDTRMATWREYEPDFVAVIESDAPCHVVIEVKGQEDPASKLKKEVAERWCEILSQSDHANLRGDWKYLYVTDPDQFSENLNEIVSIAT